MKMIVKSVAAMVAATMAMRPRKSASSASAWAAAMAGGGGGGGGVPEAPEINVAQGFAALAILACAALLLRERFLRQR